MNRLLQWLHWHLFTLPNSTAAWQPTLQFPFCFKYTAGANHCCFFHLKWDALEDTILNATSIHSTLNSKWHTWMQINTFTMFLFPLQSLLSVHDAVAQRDFEPTLPPIPDEVLEEDEDSVKIVSLVKTKEPLVSKHVWLKLIVWDIHMPYTMLSCQELMRRFIQHHSHAADN